MSTEARAPVEAPERIWLQDGCDEEGCECGACQHLKEYEGVTWCGEPIHDNDTEYVRADLLRDLSRKLEEAKAERMEIVATLDANSAPTESGGFSLSPVGRIRALISRLIIDANQQRAALEEARRERDEYERMIVAFCGDVDSFRTLTPQPQREPDLCTCSGEHGSNDNCAYRYQRQENGADGTSQPQEPATEGEEGA